MWAIYGARYDDYYGQCCCNNISDDIVIATFDTKKSAEKYLKKSRLKNPKWQHKFRFKSLLSMCEYAHVSEYESLDEPIHEPEIK